MARKADYAVAYRQESGQPWIGLPGIATEGDADQMFESAGLAGWNVRKQEIITGARTDSPDFEVVRDNPEDGLLDRLHIAKTRYEEFQNEGALDFAKSIPHGDLAPVAMGAVNGGRQIFMAFRLGESVTIQGTDDEVEHYLNILTSHDGSWAFGAYVGNMRMRCQNMIRSIKSNAFSSFKARHTKSLEGRIQDARTALGVAVKQNAIFDAEMAKLAAQEVTDNQFWALVNDIFPKPEKDVRGSLAKWQTKTDTIVGLWNGETVANLDKTAYRAYNALNEYGNWYATVRAGNVENALLRASGFDEVTVKADLAMFRKVLALGS